MVRDAIQCVGARRVSRCCWELHSTAASAAVGPVAARGEIVAWMGLVALLSAIAPKLSSL